MSDNSSPSTYNVASIEVINISQHPVSLKSPDRDSVHIPPSVHGKPARVQVKFFQWIEHDPKELRIVGYYDAQHNLVTDLPENFLKQLATMGNKQGDAITAAEARKLNQEHKPMQHNSMSVTPKMQQAIDSLRNGTFVDNSKMSVAKDKQAALDAGSVKAAQNFAEKNQVAEIHTPPLG